MTKRLLFLTSFFLCISMSPSCGIGLDDKPRSLSAELPDTLIEGAITTTEAPSILETVQIFLAKDSEEGSMFLEAVGGCMSTVGTNIALGARFRATGRGVR